MSYRFANEQSGQAFDINKTTKLILDQCDGIKNIESVALSLAEHFPNDLELIKQNVVSTLQYLASRGAIQFKRASIEPNHPFHFFDAIYCINLDRETGRWLNVMAQFDELGIGSRAHRFSAIETPHNHHIGCALSHRHIIQTASNQQFNNVLVLEDDVIFDANTLTHFEKSLTEIKNIDWDILYLGGHCWGNQYPLANECEYVRKVPHSKIGPTTTHALAYNHSVFATLLKQFPDTVIEMETYLKENQPAIDHFLAIDTTLKRVLTEPLLASQPPLLEQEADSFVPILSKPQQ